MLMALAVWCLIMYVRDATTIGSASAAKQGEGQAGNDYNSNSNSNSNGGSNVDIVASYDNVDGDGMIDENKNNFRQHAYLESLRKNRQLRVLDAHDIENSQEKRVNILFCTS